ncbi:MAG: hypothetical protein HQ596_08960 [Candidatus Saganbacteria bacterium]|nr:hypothetical protein [Candidatus Saganbacteria bacterium]
MTNDKLKMTNGGRGTNYIYNIAEQYIHLTFVIRHLSFILLLLIGSLLIVGSQAYAEDIAISSTEDASQLISNFGGLGLGYVKVGSSEVGTLSWHPDVAFGPFTLGLDGNLALGTNTPPNFNNVVIRHAGYDDGKRGLMYGVIEDVTWGHGLLMDNFSTRLTGSILLSNDQLAWKGYLDFDKVVVRALTTQRAITGIRLEERVHPMVVLGQTYITDSDGVTVPSTSVVQKVSGVGLDASVPLPWGFEGYAEYAQLIDHGSGYGAGIEWGWDFMVAAAEMSAGYRFLDNGFVPGYFNAEYESNPIDLASAEATGNNKNGYIAQMGIAALGLTTLKVRYENYNESDAALNAEAYTLLPHGIEVGAYFAQPRFVNFRSLSFEEGSIIGGSAAYPVNDFTKIVIHYKKYYDTATSQVEESQYYELKFSF